MNITVFLRSYETPEIDDEYLRIAVNDFCMAVANSLRQGTKCKGIIKVPFRHDIYNYFFSDKSELYRDDFDTRYFPEGWDQLYRKCGDLFEGVMIDFPIHVWKKIQWTKTTEYYIDGSNRSLAKKRTFREIVKLEIVKVNASFNVQHN